MNAMLLIVLKALASLAYLLAGGAKLMKAKPLVEEFHDFRLPLEIMYFIGVVETLGAIALWFEFLEVWAFSGLACLMLRAMKNHVAAKHPFSPPFAGDGVVLHLRIRCIARELAEIALLSGIFRKAFADRISSIIQWPHITILRADFSSSLITVIFLLERNRFAGIYMMMDRYKWACLAACYALAACGVEKKDGTLFLSSDGNELLSYQFQPLENPAGGDKFKGSNFIHPLKTPSGFCVTDSQPSDHLHHFGLWWPWKKIKVDGREIITWELQKGEGLIEARKATPTQSGFIAESDYIDRTAPGGPLVVLKETAKVDRVDFKAGSADGYYLDIEIIHRCATEHPVEISQYRYSGFSIRASNHWNKDNSTILTSEGKGRYEANFTRACWLRAEGEVPMGGKAGLLMMGHPANHAHPELLRTWDTAHNGAVFINFNPVQDAPWNFEPGQDYVRRYRVFIYDGALKKEQADRLWEEYRNDK